VVLHALRKDGFTYLASRGNWAMLTTKPLALFEPSLTGFYEMCQTWPWAA